MLRPREQRVTLDPFPSMLAGEAEQLKVIRQRGDAEGGAFPTAACP